jgi:glucosyl-3-phosphoglycerate synthase
LFDKITFENDYGVDIGILIDMNLQNVRIKEVFIGDISNKMKPWQELGKMSHEVARTIISRGLKHSSTLVNLDSLQTINIIRDQMEFAIKDSIKGLKKMAIFDMDNTILDGRFIETSSKILNFEKEFLDVVANNDEPYLVTKGIAKLLKGFSLSELLNIADNIILNEGIAETVKELKSRGYIVGIITDSYDFVAGHIKNKIGADFALANELEFSNSVCTGEVKIPSFFIKNEESKCNHNYCKSNALVSIAKQHQIDLSNIISVGDSKNDICVVRLSGIGVAYKSNDGVLNSSADKLINGSFTELLEYAL